MARVIFECIKVVLKKVSFNSDLFSKELKKNFQRLLPYEITELIIWSKYITLNKPKLSFCIF